MTTKHEVIQEVYNESAKSTFRRHVDISYDESTKKYAVSFSTTYDTAKNADDRRKELQIFLSLSELKLLNRTINDYVTR